MKDYMALQLYNTLVRKKQAFESLHGGKVGLYACGPTVYHFAHIGNMRAYLAWDVLVRVLARRKMKVTHVMNVTDVGHLQNDSDTAEDKLEKAAREEHKTPQQIAEFYTQAFLSDLKKLHIQPPTTLPKASEHIPEMIKLIQKLEKKGYTYTTPHGIYFDVQKFPRYGKISGQNLDQLKAVRESVERDAHKRHPADFRLWQLNQPHHIQQWDSPWGKGYPGWHIECSAMSMKYLGETFDIHTGGMDHVPIHHPNEIAQSEAATGKLFVRFWLHNAFIQIDKNKMSKSLRNIHTLADLEKKGYSALDYRYLVLTTHYRSELNFTWESIEVAKRTREKWNEFIQRLQKWPTVKTAHDEEVEALIDATAQRVEEHLDDDLNTPLVLADLSDFQRQINIIMAGNLLSKKGASSVLRFLQDINKVLDVFDFTQEEKAVPAHVLQLAHARESARKAKDWKEADRLRHAIEQEGFLVSDTKDGFELAEKK